MERLKRFILKIEYGIKNSAIRRRTLTWLAAVVVFVTTYLLILPALTIEKQEAEKMPGMDIVASQNEVAGQEGISRTDGNTLGEDILSDEDWAGAEEFWEDGSYDAFEDDFGTAGETSGDAGKAGDSRKMIESADDWAEGGLFEEETEDLTEAETFFDDWDLMDEWELMEDSQLLAEETEAADALQEGTESSASLPQETETSADLPQETAVIGSLFQEITEVSDAPEKVQSATEQPKSVAEAVTEAATEPFTGESSEVSTEPFTGESSEVSTESFTEVSSEVEAERSTAVAAETEKETLAETITEVETEEHPAEAVIETEKELLSEAVTEAKTELLSEAVTEAETELLSEAVTEAETELLSEVVTEEETELLSELITETPSTEMLTEEPAEPVYEDGELLFEGADYSVRLAFTAQAQIPEGAYLQVRELEPGTQEYEDCLAAAKAATGLKDEDELPAEQARFFDITIMCNIKSGAEGQGQSGKETAVKIEPKASVSVQITCENISCEPDGEDLNVLHYAESAQEPELLEISDLTKEESSSATVTSVVFDTDSFSIFGIVGTTIEKTVLASDGRNYRITVSYDAQAGIPENAQLAVSEIKEGHSAYGKNYEEYVLDAENALGIEKGSAGYIRLFDIKIVDRENPDVCYQPADGKTVSVKIELADIVSDSLSVVHFADESRHVNVVENETKASDDGEIVSFESNGFSVYVVVDHEDNTVVTPRVEFHFIAPLSGEAESGTLSGSVYQYTSEPYSFLNKGDADSDEDPLNDEYQHTQILKNGEALELIQNPANKTDPDRYFFGWYVVEPVSVSENVIIYRWTENPTQIEMETPISITPETGLAIGDTVSWTMASASGSGTVDADGCTHVYLAPIYEDYYFVNFHLGPKEDAGTDEDPGLARSLMTRKLIVLGTDGEAQIRIGDIQAESPDAVHKIFIGWETVREENGTLVKDQEYITLDQEGNEINEPSGKTGYYITVDKEENIDLYPVFAEARWVYFNTGKSGNGATYVGARYLLTSDEISGESPYYFETLPVSERNGYEFKGWYIAQDGDENGTGDCITDLATLDEDSRTIGFVDKYVKYDTDGQTKLWEIKDGKMYFYKAMDDVHFYAKWEEVADSSINVIIWKQKVTDNKNASDNEKTYDYVDSVTIPCNSGMTLEQIRNSGMLNNYISTGVNAKYTGFTYRTTEMSSGMVKGDKTTVVNVYYDRNLMTINWRNGNNAQNVSAYEYMQTDANSGELYGWVNGQYVPISGAQGADYHTYTYTPIYTATTEQVTDCYGIVNGQYVALTATPSSSTDYYKPQYTYTQNTNANTNAQLYGISSSGDYIQLNKKNQTEYIYTYNDGGNVRYEGIFYTRTNRRPNNYDYAISTGGWFGTTYYYVNSGYSAQNPPSNWSNNYYAVYDNGESAAALSRSTTTSYYWEDADGTEYETRYTRANYNGSDTYTEDELSNRGGELYYSDNNGGYVPVVNDHTEVTAYTYSYNGVPYTGTRYLQNDTSTTYTGIRYADANGTVSINENGSGQYGRDSNGVIVALNHETGPSYSWTYVDDNGDIQPYSGKRYTRARVNTSEFTGLYGQRLTQYGYVWPTEYNWYSSSSGGSRLTFIDSFRFDDYEDYCNGQKTVMTLYRRTASSTNRYIKFYLQNVDGSWPDEPNNTMVAGSTTANFSLGNKYSGFELDSYSVDGAAWRSGSVNQSISYDRELRIRFARDSEVFALDSNYPKTNVIYFDGEQWEVDNYADYPGLEKEREHSVLYEGSLSSYGSNGSNYWVPKAPDHYIFDGWYEDATCTVPFNFNSSMPAANKVVYAKWTPENFRVHINPNGAVIDHSSFFGTYYTDKATYINADYGTEISEYTMTRNYVPISDAVAEGLNSDDVYYYMYASYYENTGRGLPADLRNALYLKESELESYYNYYVSTIEAKKAEEPERYGEVTILGFNAWKNDYVSSQKYRKLYANESYVFLGWFKDDESMPFNFSDPVEESFTLTAHWRLDGGYYIQYIPEYRMGNGVLINGDMDRWRDPDPGATYADQAITTTMQQPTGLTADGSDVIDDSYIFLGWRIVAVQETVDGEGNITGVTYTPLEKDEQGHVVYHRESENLTIEAKYADPNGRICLQAVYEAKAGSVRRPEIANLTLDANTGYISQNESDELTASTNLEPLGDVGTVLLDVNEGREQIVFGDIQSNIAVHLDDYAVSPNYFVHPDGFFLLGFDQKSDALAITRLDPLTGEDTGEAQPYVPNYPADSVIAVQRTDEETLYAIWEPMVYLNIVNDTGVGPVTFSLTATDESTLYVVNVKDGLYERTPLTSLGSITVPATEGENKLMLAIPRGAEQDITISGTNTLGTGNILRWDTSVTIGGTTFDTQAGDSSYSHTNTDGAEHTHALAEGQKNNTEAFTFNEKLIVNETGLTVTFTSEHNDYAIILNDNYPGGGTQEYDYATEEITSAASASLPNTSTRVGYEFLGWSTDPEAETPEYSSLNDWTINDLQDFFAAGTVTEPNGTITKTLYAVWDDSATSHVVRVYKDVPLPGNQEQEFIFRVSLSGTFKRGNSNYEVAGSHDFLIKHGGYLVITSSNSIGSGSSRAFVQADVKVYDANGTEQTGQNYSVRWQHSSNGEGSFNGTERINVTEQSVQNYATSMTRAAQTTIHTIKLDGTEIEDEPMLVVEGNSINFNTEAGGRVIFTNTRQTTDVTVNKELVGETTGSFWFTGSYTADGKEVTLAPFTVVAGSSVTLHDIPVGAELTIAEEGNDNYDVVTSFANDSSDMNVSSDEVNFTVPFGGETVTYQNTLKSFPVKIVKVDQGGNGGIEARFNLTKGASSVFTGQTTTPSNNVIYDGRLYVGDYKLTESWVQPGYIGLSSPVTLSVTGDGGLTVDHENAVVEGNASDGFILKVYNQATVDIRIAKILEDPLMTREFTFQVDYSYTLNGKTISESREVTMASGSSEIVSVPVGAELTVTEKDTYHAYDNYNTTAVMKAVDASSVEDTETEDQHVFKAKIEKAGTLTFTNTRKTRTVKIVKVINATAADQLEKFTFAAELKNGANLIDYDLNGFADGSYAETISLGHNEQILLTVPVGATLVMNETPENALYDTACSVTEGVVSVFAQNNAGFSMTVPDIDSTVTVTNTKKYTVTVVKNADGSEVDMDAQYTFTATGLSEEPEMFKLHGRHKDAQENDPEQVNSKIFADVPFGTIFSVTEEEDAAFETSVVIRHAGGTDPAGTDITGIGTGNVTVDGDVTITFTNMRTVQPVKILKVNEGSTPLAGAVFALYSKEEYQKPEGSRIAMMSDLRSSESTGLPLSNIDLGNLAVGEYYLVETIAPAGYIPLDRPVIITVEKSRVYATLGSDATARNIADWVESESFWRVTVNNNPGVSLPSTGGPGTRLFYLLGAVLTAGAGMLLWRRRKQFS